MIQVYPYPFNKQIKSLPDPPPAKEREVKDIENKKHVNDYSWLIFAINNLKKSFHLCNFCSEKFNYMRNFVRDSNVQYNYNSLKKNGKKNDKGKNKYDEKVHVNNNNNIEQQSYSLGGCTNQNNCSNGHLSDNTNNMNPNIYKKDSINDENNYNKFTKYGKHIIQTNPNSFEENVSSIKKYGNETDRNVRKKNKTKNNSNIDKNEKENNKKTPIDKKVLNDKSEYNIIFSNSLYPKEGENKELSFDEDVYIYMNICSHMKMDLKKLLKDNEKQEIGNNEKDAIHNWYRFEHNILKNTSNTKSNDDVVLPYQEEFENLIIHIKRYMKDGISYFGCSHIKFHELCTIKEENITYDSVDVFVYDNLQGEIDPVDNCDAHIYKRENVNNMIDLPENIQNFNNTGKENVQRKFPINENKNKDTKNMASSDNVRHLSCNANAKNGKKKLLSQLLQQELERTQSYLNGEKEKHPNNNLKFYDINKYSDEKISSFLKNDIDNYNDDKFNNKCYGKTNESDEIYTNEDTNLYQKRNDIGHKEKESNLNSMTNFSTIFFYPYDKSFSKEITNPNMEKWGKEKWGKENGGKEIRGKEKWGKEKGGNEKRGKKQNENIDLRNSSYDNDYQNGESQNVSTKKYNMDKDFLKKAEKDKKWKNQLEKIEKKQPEKKKKTFLEELQEKLQQRKEMCSPKNGIMEENKRHISSPSSSISSSPSSPSSFSDQVKGHQKRGTEKLCMNKTGNQKRNLEMNVEQNVNELNRSKEQQHDFNIKKNNVLYFNGLKTKLSENVVNDYIKTPENIHKPNLINKEKNTDNCLNNDSVNKYKLEEEIETERGKGKYGYIPFSMDRNEKPIKWKTIDSSSSSWRDNCSEIENSRNDENKKERNNEKGRGNENIEAKENMELSENIKDRRNLSAQKKPKSDYAHLTKKGNTNFMKNIESKETQTTCSFPHFRKKESEDFLLYHARKPQLKEKCNGSSVTTETDKPKNKLENFLFENDNQFKPMKQQEERQKGKIEQIDFNDSFKKYEKLPKTEIDDLRDVLLHENRNRFKAKTSGSLEIEKNLMNKNFVNDIKWKKGIENKNNTGTVDVQNMDSDLNASICPNGNFPSDLLEEHDNKKYQDDICNVLLQKCRNGLKNCENYCIQNPLKEINGDEGWYDTAAKNVYAHEKTKENKKNEKGRLRFSSSFSPTVSDTASGIASDRASDRTSDISSPAASSSFLTTPIYEQKPTTAVQINNNMKNTRERNVLNSDSLSKKLLMSRNQNKGNTEESYNTNNIICKELREKTGEIQEPERYEDSIINKDKYINNLPSHDRKETNRRMEHDEEEVENKKKLLHAIINKNINTILNMYGNPHTINVKNRIHVSDINHRDRGDSNVIYFNNNFFFNSDYDNLFHVPNMNTKKHEANSPVSYNMKQYDFRFCKEKENDNYYVKYMKNVMSSSSCNISSEEYIFRESIESGLWDKHIEDFHKINGCKHSVKDCIKGDINDEGKVMDWHGNKRNCVALPGINGRALDNDISVKPSKTEESFLKRVALRMGENEGTIMKSCITVKEARERGGNSEGKREGKRGGNSEGKREGKRRGNSEGEIERKISNNKTIKLNDSEVYATPISPKKQEKIPKPLASQLGDFLFVKNNKSPSYPFEEFTF